MGGEGREAMDLAVGYRTLAVLMPVYALALVAYAVRIWTRIRPKYRLNAADHTITVAFVSVKLLEMTPVTNKPSSDYKRRAVGRNSYHHLDHRRRIMGLRSSPVKPIYYRERSHRVHYLRRLCHCPLGVNVCSNLHLMPTVANRPGQGMETPSPIHRRHPRGLACRLRHLPAGPMPPNSRLMGACS